MGQTQFGKLFVGLYFLKKYYVVTLLYTTIYEKWHHIWQCIWGNAWFVSMEKSSIFIKKLLRMDFISFCIICKIKDALIFGKIDTKSSWQEMSLKALRTLWIFWIFQRFLWNYLKLNCVWISCKLWALYVFPWAVTWLPGDYLARYYSLCDLGILAPIFVMVISFGFVSAVRSDFVSAD